MYFQYVIVLMRTKIRDKILLIAMLIFLFSHQDELKYYQKTNDLLFLSK